jgi:energy-coupling factor transporter ATP-binding protein EcfA2
MKALDVKNLSYVYPDGKPALRGVTIDAAEGECIGVIGPNGAGKSTLMLHLNGILPDTPADTPAVFVYGKGVSGENLHEIHRDVGVLFQDPDDQLFCPTVFEDVAFGPQQFGMSETEVSSAVHDALSHVGLAGFESRTPHHLSGGEKQRVCLAGILACSPRILVLDEPTSDLDPRGRRELTGLLRGLAATRVIASHDLELIVELCSRTYLLDGGEVISFGPTKSLLSDEQLMLDHGLEMPHILKHRHPH